jgi:transposase-like protein
MNLMHLLDDEKCFQVVQERRWPEGVRCPRCRSTRVTKQGRDDTQRARQRYRCLACQQKFDDLTHTVFAGHHQPLRVWVACLYLMGLNLSNRQIAHELGLNEDDAQQMAHTLRQGVVDSSTTPQLSGTVEIDEVYVVARHKGQPAEIQKKGVQDEDDA